MNLLLELADVAEERAHHEESSRHEGQCGYRAEDDDFAHWKQNEFSNWGLTFYRGIFFAATRRPTAISHTTFSGRGNGAVPLNQLAESSKPSGMTMIKVPIL